MPSCTCAVGLNKLDIDHAREVGEIDRTLVFGWKQIDNGRAPRVGAKDLG